MKNYDETDLFQHAPQLPANKTDLPNNYEKPTNVENNVTFQFLKFVSKSQFLKICFIII